MGNKDVTNPGKLDAKFPELHLGPFGAIYQ